MAEPVAGAVKRLAPIKLFLGIDRDNEALPEIGCKADDVALLRNSKNIREHIWENICPRHAPSIPDRI